MRVLVNGLSTSGLSGRHVVLGFMKPLTRWTEGEHEFLFLHPPEWETESLKFSQNITYEPAPQGLEHWAKRSWWEARSMPGLICEKKIDLVFTPSGAITPGCPVPQVSLGQNPWCMVRNVQQGISEKTKAFVQRRAYRHALKHAAKMFYISKHLRGLYCKLAGEESPDANDESKNNIAYPALDEATHASAEKARAEIEKQPLRILSVSAMAPWKGIDTIVAATKKLRDSGIAAELHLVGPWTVPSYKLQIEAQIESLKLHDAVFIKGKVSKEELHQNYAEAKVFCLMSQCESFGIPAAEAQAFGTPVVGSDVCAMPEICGEGGLFGPPRDIDRTAEMLALLLTDQAQWNQFSEASVKNAARYRWEECTKPLLSMFDL